MKYSAAKWVLLLWPTWSAENDLRFASVTCNLKGPFSSIYQIVWIFVLDNLNIYYCVVLTLKGTLKLALKTLKKHNE